MFTYWIAGVPKCSDFCHAKLIAEKLKRSLPHFSYRTIMKTEEQYQVPNNNNKHTILIQFRF